MMKSNTDKLVLLVKCTHPLGSEMAEAEGMLLSDIRYSENNGYGAVAFTREWSRAKMFSTMDEADKFLSSPSPIRPIVDGKPWRPAEEWDYLCVTLSDFIGAEAMVAMDDDESTRH